MVEGVGMMIFRGELTALVLIWLFVWARRTCADTFHSCYAGHPLSRDTNAGNVNERIIFAPRMVNN